MSDLQVPHEGRARPSLLGRLDRALPVAVKVAVPVILIAALVVLLVSQALVRTLRSHVLDTYGLTATSVGRLVASHLERGSADPDGVERLLRRFVQAEVLVESANLYLVQGDTVVFFAGSDPSPVAGEHEQEPDEEDIAVALSGRPRSHQEVEEGRRFLETTVPVRVDGDVVGSLGVYISLQGLDVAIADARERVFLVVLLGGGSALLMTGLVVYSVLIRRARRLSKAASQLAAGDLRVRLAEGEIPPGQDELLNVANALNRMVGAVQARIRQQEAVATFGQRALDADPSAVLDEAAGLTAEALGVELSWVVERTDEGLFVRAASGWDASVVGVEIPEESQAGYTLRQNAPVLAEDIRTEERFATPALVRERGVRATVTAPIPGPDGALGVLAAQTARPRTFTADDLHFLEAMTATLGAAMQRRRTREQLATAEAKYRSLVERIPAVAYTAGFGHAATWEYVAPQIEAVLGFTAEEWTSSPQLWFDSIHPDDRDRVLAEEDISVETESHLASVYRIRTKDGRWRWVRDDAVVVRDERGEPLFFQGVMYDITDQKEAEETLRRAYDREREAVARLQAVDEMKSSFLSAVSHELRTPLSSVLGFAITLQQDLGLTEDERRESIDRLAANAHKLHRLLEDLLDVDRLSRGIVEPRRQPVDVRALALRALEETDLDGRTVETEVPSVVVEVDGPKVERILENLLVNAVKHSPAGTPLRLELRCQEGGVLIVVEDRGRGIPDDLKDDVFRPFVRGPERPSHSPGAGIGLSLVARFAELHGGRAWVEDRPGGGASFRVFLPGSSGPTDAPAHRGVGVAS